MLRKHTAPLDYMRNIISTLTYIANHPISSQHLYKAYCRYIRWQIESRLHTEIEFQWIEGSKLIARNGMTGATGNIYCGLHEFRDMVFLLHFLRPQDLYIDVGANIGSYTILASAVCKARSISVEPDPVTMDALRRNVQANRIDSRVQLVEEALGSKNGTARLTIGRDTLNCITNDQHATTREVRICTIDKLLKGMKPIFIKMDVEGHEENIIKGAENILATPTLIAIQIETVTQHTESILHSAGFRRCIYNPYTRRIAYYDHNTSNQITTQNSLYIRDLNICQQRVSNACSRQIFEQRI